MAAHILLSSRDGCWLRLSRAEAGPRALAVLEALTGQLYLTILLARLVSLELRSRRDG